MPGASLHLWQLKMSPDVTKCPLGGAQSPQLRSTDARVQDTAPGPACLRLNPGSVPYMLWGLGQVTYPFCASISSPVCLTVLLWGLHELLSERHLKWCLAGSKCCIRVSHHHCRHHHHHCHYSIPDTNAGAGNTEMNGTQTLLWRNAAQWGHQFSMLWAVSREAAWKDPAQPWVQGWDRSQGVPERH